MNADAERPASLADSIADGHDDSTVDSGVPRPQLHASGCIGLNITTRDRLIALESKAGHPLADRYSGDDFRYVRRQSNLRLENEDSVLEQMNRAGVRSEPCDDLFELGLHSRQTKQFRPAESTDGKLHATAKKSILAAYV